MYIVIIGCGRTGSRLGGLLSETGHDVVVIDNNEKNFSKLPVAFSGFRIEGDAMEHEVLEEAKLAQSDIIAITTGDDRINFMIAQLADKIFNVARIFVRLVDPAKENMFVDIPSVEIFSPINLLVDSFVSKIERIEG